MRSDPNFRGLSREVNEQSLGSISLCGKICIMLCFDESQDYQDSRVASSSWRVHNSPKLGSNTNSYNAHRYSTIQYRTVPYSTPYFLQLTEMFDEDSAEDHLAVLMPGMPKIVVVNGAMALVSSLKVAHWEVVAEVYPCNTHNSHFGWPCR
jgi:hypothetical protein